MHHGPVSPEIAAGLLAIKERIAAAEIPASKLDETINIAVWNIREFGRRRRTKAAIHYIAEILGQFDLIALVELRDDLHDLGCVLPILGPSWNVVYSDWIDDRGANGERVAFLYDRRAVTFNGLAAEIDPPRTKQETEYLSSLSFWRAPYICSFRAGNFDFVAVATHIRWGSSLKGREAELQLLADWLKRRTEDKYFEDRDLLVMGDFNTPSLDHALFKALTSGGLLVPEPLVELKYGKRVVRGSNLKGNARYDQILHAPTLQSNFSNSGGTLDFYGGPSTLKKLFPNANYTPAQFTYQLSDHFPVWLQVRTDIDGYRLGQIVQNDKAK